MFFVFDLRIAAAQWDAAALPKNGWATDARKTEIDDKAELSRVLHRY